MNITSSKFAFIVLLVTTLVTNLMRLYLSVYRYFDPDEFAHLHWAYHFMIGQVPYKDFFIYHIPFYQWFLLPIFLLPQSPEAIIFSRLVMSFIFLISCGILAHLAYKISRHTITALFTVLFMTVSPIMIDKGIEVRPDVLMVLFFILTMWILFLKPHTTKYLFLGGIFLGLSMLTFQKMIFALPSLAILLLYRPLNQLLSKKNINNIEWKPWLYFVLGGLLTIVLFFLYLIINGALLSGLDAIIRTTKDIYALQIIKFSPFLALTPWQFVYVSYEGPSLPWAFNTFLLFAMGGGTMLFAI
jgi:hypothetical protein